MDARRLDAGLRRAAFLLLAMLAPAAAALAAPGVSDGEILLGQTMPYSGPISAYATVGRAMAAYLDKVNDEGGVNGRKIRLVSLDDGYSPPKTVEQTRKLVEEQQVFFLFGSLGTAPQSAVQKYLNANNVPQLFIQSGARKWNDPRHFSWSMAGLPSSYAEARAYAKYLLAADPQARIAVLYQNDDFGKDYLAGLQDGLGDKAARMIVATQSFEVTDPTVDSQIASLAGSGADTFFSFSVGKATVQAIRKVGDIGWHPLFFITAVSQSKATVLAPAGLDRAAGIISAAFEKDPSDPQWAEDADVRAFRDWMKRYYPAGDDGELLNVAGNIEAQLVVEVLRRCGEDLSRENVLRQATHLDHLALPLLLPGIAISTTPEDYRVIRAFRLQRFDGTRWVLFGDPIGS
ncbi:MAG TPA: ABC transporter substrate-binding protein [Stellaceae bacterium]|nr:ABC transporter substrate-binding protein [Stellaceae bacterium]